MKTLKITGAVLSTAALLSFSTPAWALDGKDFVKKLSSLFETGGVSVGFDEISVAGDIITLTDPTFVAPSEKPVSVSGTIVFTGVTETGDGGYEADSGTIDELVFEEEEEGVRVVVENVLMEGVKIPADIYSDPMTSIDSYSYFSVGPVNMTMMPEGTSEVVDVFSITSIEATNVVNGDVSEVTNTYAVDGISADLSQIDDPEAQGMLALFGLTQIEASMKGSSVWTLETGRIDLTESAITIDNVGTLNVTADMLGYDLALVRELQLMQKDLMADTDKSADEIDMASLEMFMGMMDKLSLAGMTVRFDDDGFTNKVLDFVASQQGAPREVLAAGFAAALPVMAAEMGAPEALQTMLLEAANAYLADPQSVKVISAPAEPVPFTELAEASEDPAELTELLNLTIEANQ